LPKTLDRFLAR